MRLHTERRSHDVTPSEVSRYLPVSFQSFNSKVFIPVWYVLPEWNSPYYNNLLALPLLSYLNVTCWSFYFFCSGAGSFRRHAQFLSSPRWKNKLPVCSWLVVTPLNFWVCMEGGVRGRAFLPPPLNASNNPPSHPPLPLTDHWALSLLGHCEHFPPIRMDSSRVRGHVWPFMDQWGAGGG